MNDNNKEIENSINSKELTSQNHSIEPPITIFNKLNSIAKGNFHQIIPLVVCEICYKDQNLIQCKICNNGFHKKCLNTAFLPEPFICFNCKKQFTEEEINSILNNNNYNQANKSIRNGNKIHKEFEQSKNIKKKIQTNIIISSPTKIIELEEDNKKDNENENKKGGNLINNNIDNNLNKKKNNKKIIDNMSEINMNENCDKSETKSIKKENKSKLKIDIEKNGGLGISLENELCESSVMSRSQEITIDKPYTKNKRKRERDKEKEKELNSTLKSKNSTHNQKKGNSPGKAENLSSSNLNNDFSFTNKDKINKDEQSIQSTKKSNKKKVIEQKGEKESLLLSLTHTDPQYKRRKIKIGSNRQCNMYEFTDKYENKINFDEEEYERNDLIQVWSKENNPLTEEELNKYIETAKIFWNYRNVHIEEDLCADFFQECETKMKSKKIVPKLKNKITKLIKELKELIKRGINLNSHYDEMSLRVLHLCKYKTNIALLFLYKGLNPFIEEVEEGFKHDIYFFQDEIYSFINNGDFFDPDN